ncbi:MAG: ATP-binding protein [ANME-2 cluster archaeon]|jgi:predicted AAA+ superfamily ATPase|nr:ATP-binding protein [ANME-2 cluster archaeon]
MKEILKRWNPWWLYGKVPESKKRIERPETLDGITKLLKIKEIISITGVRRCGKSTVLYQAIDYLVENGIHPTNILYFNLDEPHEDKSISILDSIFENFIEINNPAGRKYIFLDEIQNIKNWEKWLKKYYDLYDTDIKFVITGSNSTMLSDNLSTLLTGRVISKPIYPLSFKEYLEFAGFKLNDTDVQRSEVVHHFLKYLNNGGFPEVVLEADVDINHMRLNEYFDSILLRDIVVRKKIRESSKLIELANYSLTNISALLSYMKISKAIGMSVNSVKEYLLYLEQAYLIYQLNFFSYSIKTSLAIQKPRKIYCIDNGLRNAASFKFSSDEGKLAENSAFIELKRRNHEVYYWNGHREVDFVVKNRDNTLIGINVTYTDVIDEREIKALLEFKENFQGRVSELILLTRNVDKSEDGIMYVPIWKWLLGYGE